jgi:hypothetical protein
VLSDELKAALSEILHVTGDCVSVTIRVPESAADLRTSLIQSVHQIFGSLQEQIENMVALSVAKHALDQPLEKEFTDESLFGFNLMEKLSASLKNDEEKSIIAELFKEEDDDDEDSEENV